MAEADPIVPINLELHDSFTLSDDDIVRLRTSTEDHFVERKTFNDWKKDALKTVVAFANSLQIGQPGYLFIGVRDNGEVEEQRDNNLDSIQKKLAEILRRVYPRVLYKPKGLRDGNNEYLVIIVHGSERRPHFSGPAYVREGSQTKDASEEHYALLIAQRLSKVREILRWKGKRATFTKVLQRNAAGVADHISPPVSRTVVDCNAFYVTLDEHLHSYPLDTITISFDHQNECLWLEVER